MERRCLENALERLGALAPVGKTNVLCRWVGEKTKEENMKSFRKLLLVALLALPGLFATGCHLVQPPGPPGLPPPPPIPVPGN